jgi:hypothetical protein
VYQISTHFGGLYNPELLCKGAGTRRINFWERWEELGLFLLSAMNENARDGKRSRTPSNALPKTHEKISTLMASELIAPSLPATARRRGCRKPASPQIRRRETELLVTSKPKLDPARIAETVLVVG